MSTTIITGASSGIGAALARELHRRGHRVGLIARREERLRELCGELGEGAAIAVADVTDADALVTAVASLEEALGPCDLMIANAGITRTGQAHKWDTAAMARVIRVDLEGVVNTFGAVIPAMLARRSGHLVAISSLGGTRGLPGAATYAAAKSGVDILCEALRIELSHVGVAVTVVRPGFVESELTAGKRFRQPFLMAAEPAAVRIADGLERRRPVISFPWQLRLFLGVAYHLPGWAWQWLALRLYPLPRALR